MKRLTILLTLLLMVGCAKKAPPNLTPQATTAFHATRVVKALDLAMDAAMAAEAQTPKAISTDSARQIVEFHQMAVRTIHAIPSGWKLTVSTSLDELQNHLGADALRWF